MPIRKAQPRHAQAASAVGHLPDFTKYDEIPDALRAGDDGGCCAFRIGIGKCIALRALDIKKIATALCLAQPSHRSGTEGPLASPNKGKPQVLWQQKHFH